MVKRRPLTCLICIIFIIVAVIILIALPYWRVAQFGIADPKDLAEMENSYRATLAQILGGTAVGIGVYFAWGNLTTAREGQITERFTRAVDQFGSKELEIRLGGIYALERISMESDKDYWPIMEILTVYVRKNSSAEIVESKRITPLAMDIQANESTTRKVSEVRKVSLDIQAVLTVIRRRNDPINAGKPIRLNLRKTYLRETDLYEANLKGADLEGVDLTGANLEGADLEGAHLEGADFEGAHLEGANLQGANLRGANFTGAHLEGANLKGVDFTEIDFTDYTIIKEANFEGAHLEGANLTEACLCEANLTKAHFEGANLQGANLRGANFTGAYLCEANLRGAYLDRVPDLFLEGANLKGVHLKGANLKGAYFEGANIKEANFEGAHLEGADFTEVDFVEDYTDSSLFPGVHNKHNLTTDQLSKVKSLYGATNLNPELETPLREKHPEIFKETTEHKSYRENVLQSR
ncbi:pentapeptide repeat-containing protein [Methanosarcina sp. Kolksee]|uniref:pentapeptide repeat-containing protein n=1 Tax=Methanosarcina sp. Kolksee TaxID=1434099 RepID=UPI001E4E10DF|nr:pentapeptide repeat-containing protein [Methanosarcina sp. Kolksee]